MNNLLVVFLFFFCCICFGVATEQLSHDEELALIFQRLYNAEVSVDPDTKKNISELITSKGYPCEQYYATTSDGYVLSVQRIPYSKSNRGFSGKRPVVFLQHGVLDSAHTWVANYPHQSLAFMLADAGFDVWLGNVRGNLYSRHNTHIPVTSSEFWAFSWDDHASKDLPAMIDLVLRTTNQPKLAAYVGHSQGGTTGFALLSTRKDMANKVNLFVALAPVLNMKYQTSKFLRALADIHLEKFLALLGMKEFLPSTNVIEFLLPHVCDKAQWFCKNIYCLFVGCDSSSVNATRLQVYLSHLPAGTSVQNMAHWAQAVRSGDFRYYDFGSASKNMKHYGEPTPPFYKVENFSNKLVVYYGGKDPLADPADVKGWLSKVPNGLLLHAHEYPSFGHCDLVWGISPEAIEMNKQIASFIREHA